METFTGCNCRYRPGDVVMVREDLVAGEKYRGECDMADVFVVGMDVYRGKSVTISKIFSGKYCIQEDDGAWFWTNEMFKGLVKPRYKAGDRVVVRDDLVLHHTYGIDVNGQQCRFVPPMDSYLGKAVTIGTVVSASGAEIRYKIREDDMNFSWTDDMFVGLADENSVNTTPKENGSPAQETFDCSEAENDFLDGYFVCTNSSNEKIIARGDVICVMFGCFHFNNVHFHHVFSVSAIVWALKERFGVETDFVRLREAR